jgi:hypothetical protein
MLCVHKREVTVSTFKKAVIHSNVLEAIWICGQIHTFLAMWFE